MFVRLAAHGLFICWSLEGTSPPPAARFSHHEAQTFLFGSVASSLCDLRPLSRSLTSSATQILCATCRSSQVVRTTLPMFLRSSI
jgi:hypothetical protein